MADFVQNNVTQSAVRELAEPIADNEKNKKPGPIRYGEQGTGQKITETRIHKAARTKTAPHLVKRVTALIGQTIARPQEPKGTHRRRTQLDIYGKDPEIPYVKFEAASRDLVCSLMERQDRMNEEIFSKINDLGYRVEYLEQGRNNDGSGR
jgi:hypothetical protein